MWNLWIEGPVLGHHVETMMERQVLGHHVETMDELVLGCHVELMGGETGFGVSCGTYGWRDYLSCLVKQNLDSSIRFSYMSQTLPLLCEPIRVEFPLACNINALE